jgi:hypothetical protein
MFDVTLTDTQVSSNDKKESQWLLVRKRIIPTDGRRLMAKLVEDIADRGRRVVSAMDLHGR